MARSIGASAQSWCCQTTSQSLRFPGTSHVSTNFRASKNYSPKTPTALTDYLSMGQAATLLGWSGGSSGQRLRRFLVAKETRSGNKIAVRRKSKLYVTESLLRHHCPELFDTREEMAAHLRSIFKKQDAAIANIRNDVEDLREAMERMILLQKARAAAPASRQIASD